MEVSRRQITILLVVIVVAGIAVYAYNSNRSNMPSTPNTPQTHRTFWLNAAISPSPTWNDSVPSPQLTVNSGDRVTLMLKSTDGIGHEWFIDFNNNQHQDNNETFVSPIFNQPNSFIEYSFTPVVGQNVTSSGTYQYRCAFHPSMVGSVTINP
jgi:plastocyanin